MLVVIDRSSIDKTRVDLGTASENLPAGRQVQLWQQVSQTRSLLVVVELDIDWEQEVSNFVGRKTFAAKR